MKTSELEGAKLDLMVAKALNWKTVDGARIDEWLQPGGVKCPSVYEPTAEEERDFEPSSNWTDAGPIIEREQIAVMRDKYAYDVREVWDAWVGPVSVSDIEGEPHGFGPTPLIAAMRAFVASRFGEEVPDA
jgi:hypothetical protein